MYGQGDTAGRVAINKIPLSTNQACCNLVINHKFADYEFVYYALCSMYDSLVSLKNGGAQPNLNATKIKEIEIPFPELVVQRRIARCLSNYDNLIENNQKQIKLLEEAAQRLYKEWFVDFRFPGYENTPIVNGLPEGWKKSPIGANFRTVLGGTPSRANPNFWGGDINWINSGAVNNIRIIKASEYITELGLEASSTKMMPKSTTLIAITGATLGQVSFTEIETCANQSVVGIIDESQLYSKYVYLYVTEKIWHMIGKATGGAQQHINKEIVNAYPIVLPPVKIIKGFNEVVTPFFKKIATLLFQNEGLRKACDRLLPKLMSGEIEVSGKLS